MLKSRHPSRCKNALWTLLHTPTNVAVGADRFISRSVRRPPLVDVGFVHILNGHAVEEGLRTVHLRFFFSYGIRHCLVGLSSLDSVLLLYDYNGREQVG